MDLIEDFTSNYTAYINQKIRGRYVTHKMISPLLEDYSEKFNVEPIGVSVLNNPIHKLTIGSGKNRILIWSQMHGNESTTTKALFDFLNYIDTNIDVLNYINENFTLCIIPILNPDGALAYTRINANEIDLNRDAQNQSQPESRILRVVFNEFKPDYCFNLHDQRTIFSAGNHKKSATISFLTPAEDEERKVTQNRKRSMEVIVAMNKMLQKYIPKQVGRYDDGFNLNCVGDTFQSLGVPTILFESGHYPNDYMREETRKYIAYSFITALQYINLTEVTGKKHHDYFHIPENEKLFYDIILRNFPIATKEETEFKDVAIFFKETLINDKIEFKPSIEHIEKHLHYYGHKELDMRNVGVDPVPIHELNNSYLTDLLRKI